MSSATEQIRGGTRSLEDVEGLDWIRDLEWHAESQAWYFEISLELDLHASSSVPQKTCWCVRVDPAYPLGSIDIFPSQAGGLVGTFPHQLNNSPVGLRDLPWLPGKICVETGTASLDRHGKDQLEERSAEGRLRWHIDRTRLWIETAARGELICDGDAFELPDYRPSGDGLLFLENDKTLKRWAAESRSHGLVHLAQVNRHTRAVVAFETFTGSTVCKPAWGPLFAALEPTDVGLWLRVPDVVAITPWQAPMTWGDLTEALRTQGVDVLDILSRTAARFRDGREHPLLIGFPIPRIAGSVASRMHWLALRLPPLTRRGARVSGFRSNERGLWNHDRTKIFAASRAVEWTPAENADDADLTSRGSLNSTWRKSRVLCIGVGALGSAISELLVRGGVRTLSVCDPEVLEVGNLVRHILSLRDVGRSKAKGVSERLNDISPHASVQAIFDSFPPSLPEQRELVANAGIVLDCSANDDVLYHLQSFPFLTAPVVFHVSFGREAQRLYLYGSSNGPLDPTGYLDWIDPWLAAERKEAPSDVRPTAGCWHPAFPARPDHVWLLAAAATAWMGEQLERSTFEEGLVLERRGGPCLAQVTDVSARP